MSDSRRVPVLRRAMIGNLLDPGRPARAAGDPRPDARHLARRRRRHSGRRSVDTSRSTSRAPGSSSCPGSTTSCGQATRRPSSRRSRRSSPVPIPFSRRIVASPRCCSRTSSARRSARPRLATAPGASSSIATMPSSVRASSERAGRLVKTTGDGVLATFDGPGRALEASREISTGGAESRPACSGRPARRGDRDDRRRHRGAGRPRCGSRVRARRARRGAREQHCSRPRRWFRGGVQRSVAAAS